MSTLGDLRTLLANLSGEESAPTDASRDVFINQAIKYIYAKRQWKFRKAKDSSLSFTAGVATAPTTMAMGDGFGDLRIANGLVGSGDDYVFTLIDETEKDNYDSSVYTCWLSGNEIDGITINTNQTTDFTAELIYYKKPTTLSGSSDNCYIPSDLAVCFQALAFTKMYNDPDTDASQEMGIANRHISEMISQESKSISHRLKSPYEVYGYSLGDF